MEHIENDSVTGIPQRRLEILEHLSVTKLQQFGHVLHGNDIGFTLDDQTSEVTQERPIGIVVVSIVGGERLARSTTHQHPVSSIDEQIAQVAAVQGYNVLAEKRRMNVRFIGISTCLVRIDSSRDRKTLFAEAVREPARTGKQIDDGSRGNRSGHCTAILTKQYVFVHTAESYLC